MSGQLLALGPGDLFTLPWWLGVPLIVYWVVVVLLLVMDDREPSSTLTWLFILVFLPIVGLVVFLFFGRDWKVITARRPWAARLRAIVDARMRPIYERNAAADERFREEFRDTQAYGVARTIARESSVRILPAATLEVFATGAEKFARLLEDCATARRFIHLEYFIWEKDELTAKLTDVLLDRLQAGVEVRLMYDFIGSLTFSKRELRRLKSAGAKVSADVTTALKLNYRNHRKIAVIDAEIGYTGGMNMGQEYIDGGKRFASWRDTHMRYTGQAVAELEKLFAMRWYEDEREDILRDEYLPQPTDRAGGGILTQTVANTIEDPWEPARRAHLAAISTAQRSLRIQSPYFVPDEAMQEAIVNAALRGVDVQFMMTGVVDKALPYRAAQTYYAPLLHAGARIYQYEAGFFHAKTISVDSAFGAVGTMNMDIRSLRLHKELMVWIYDPGKARELDDIFARDLEQCREVTLEDVRSRSRWRRFRDSFARLFSAEI
jgi:cardiolipin synthase A/B